MLSAFVLLAASLITAQSAANSNPWQGEWGSFRATSNDRYTGSGIRIGECSATGCSFAIDVVTASGNGNARGTLQPDSPETATAHLAAFVRAGTLHA